MPQGLKDIRRRIRSVQSTEKITSAMKLVAASKMRRAEERARNARPYSDALTDVLRAVAAESAGQSARLPLLARREVNRTGILVIAGDRGLCGPYNAAVLRVMEQVRAEGKDPVVIAMGRRVKDYCERRRIPLLAAFSPIGDEPTDSQAREAAQTAARAFIEGEVDEVYLVATRYMGAFSSRPEAERLLPLSEPSAKGEGSGRHPYEFEPDPEAVLSRLLPAYLNSLVYRALLESKAAEWGARMMAMDSATRNAKDLARNYTRTLNRLRQAAITNEIAELVGGAQAVQ